MLQADSAFQPQEGCFAFAYYIVGGDFFSRRETDAYCGVLEIVKAAVGQNKPPPLPGFDAAAFNKDKQKIKICLGLV